MLDMPSSAGSGKKRGSALRGGVDIHREYTYATAPPALKQWVASIHRGIERYFPLPVTFTIAQERVVLEWKAFDRERRPFETKYATQVGRLLREAGTAAANSYGPTRSILMATHSAVEVIQRKAGKLLTTLYGEVGRHYYLRLKKRGFKSDLVDMLTLDLSWTALTGGGAHQAPTFEWAWRKWVHEQLAHKIKGIETATANQISLYIRNRTAEGDSVDDIRRGLIESHAFSKTRAEVIARTEVIAASNGATFFGMLAGGQKLEKNWIATGDKRTRPTHLKAGATQKNIPYDKPFEVGNSLLMFPGDGSKGASAKETIQCRCTVTYRVIPQPKPAPPPVVVAPVVVEPPKPKKPKKPPKPKPVSAPAPVVEPPKPVPPPAPLPVPPPVVAPPVPPKPKPFAPSASRPSRPVKPKPPRAELPGVHPTAPPPRLDLTQMQDITWQELRQKVEHAMTGSSAEMSGSAFKTHVMKTLAKGFEGIDAGLLEQFTAELRYHAGGNYGNTPAEKVASIITSAWAGSSDSGNMVSMGLQYRALERYNMSGVYKPGDLATRNQARSVAQKYAAIFDAYLDTTYAETQKLLKKMFPGQDGVWMWRGYNVEEMENLTSGTRNVTLQPLSSFSLQYGVSRRFGSTMLGGYIPMERIVSMYGGGLGCMNEAEFVILGSGGDDWFFHKNTYGAYNSSEWVTAVSSRRKKALLDVNAKQPPLTPDANPHDADWAKTTWDLIAPRVDSVASLVLYLRVVGWDINDFKRSATYTRFVGTPGYEWLAHI